MLTDLAETRHAPLLHGSRANKLTRLCLQLLLLTPFITSRPDVANAFDMYRRFGVHAMRTIDPLSLRVRDGARPSSVRLLNIIAAIRSSFYE